MTSTKPSILSPLLMSLALLAVPLLNACSSNELGGRSEKAKKDIDGKTGLTEQTAATADATDKTDAADTGDKAGAGGGADAFNEGAFDRGDELVVPKGCTMPADLLAALDKAALENEKDAGLGGWGAGKIKSGWGGDKAGASKGGWGGGKEKEGSKPNADLDVAKIGLKGVDLSKCPLFDKVQIKQLAVCEDTAAGQSYVEPFADRNSKACEEFAATVGKLFEAEGRKGTCACKPLAGH